MNNKRIGDNVITPTYVSGQKVYHTDFNKIIDVFKEGINANFEDIKAFENGDYDGATFIPDVDALGNISWTNDKNLDNPPTRNIRGPQGTVGPKGEQGTIFTPSVNAEGDISWLNNGGLPNPKTVNIKGPQGIQGERGDIGDKGDKGVQGDKGDKGTTFIPSVSTNGDISWVNDDGLENPKTRNIKGPQGIQGEQGIQGKQGIQGPKGTTFKPSVDESGNLSWSNEDGLVNPATRNIKGPKGDKGDTGLQGPKGEESVFNVDIEKDGFGNYTANYNDNDINNARNAGKVVQATYYNADTKQTYTYYYSTMESDRKPTFIRTYVENGQTVQVLASVGNDKKVSVTRKVGVGQITPEGGEIFNLYSNNDEGNPPNIATGYTSHAEGQGTEVSDTAAHAEGMQTIASGMAAHAEGISATASDMASHAEGQGTGAGRAAAHAEGMFSTASGYAAHAEGEETTASGDASHAEGQGTEASGYAAHAEGNYVNTSVDNSHIGGQYGTITAEANPTTLFAVANGNSETDENIGLEFKGLKGAGELYVEGKKLWALEAIPGYSATGTKTLKCVNGEFKWE